MGSRIASPSGCVYPPYWTQENHVQAALDSRATTVGFNPAGPGGIAPLGVPGTRPPTTEDIQAFVEALSTYRKSRPDVFPLRKCERV